MNHSSVYSFARPNLGERPPTGGTSEAPDSSTRVGTTTQDDDDDKDGGDGGESVGSDDKFVPKLTPFNLLWSFGRNTKVPLLNLSTRWRGNDKMIK